MTSDGAREGWRFWSVRDGQLVSPFTGDVLPLDGVAVATCIHETPNPTCECGIAYYQDKADVLKASKTLCDPGIAITLGEVTGPTYADWRAPRYQVQDSRHGFSVSRWVTLPTGLRAHAYQVTAIYTNNTITTDYGVPVHPRADIHV
ncbi:hypothetical protein [Mycolicibacterium mengxianglii]|uniref:hypothetical protein n=1 Tax=Mycolicibacterium mengxianglii TaxID=2736649 RepID=UPI0018EEDB81|nr:hypothetical protein [Mycolicibacterium mengxianglii]